MRKPFPIGDVLIFAGIALVTAGVWQIHVPSAFILLGLASVTVGFLELTKAK